MRYNNIGGARTINQYVKSKLSDLNGSGKNFETLFRIMFRESENVLCERYRGFKVIKTTYGGARDDIYLLAEALINAFPDIKSSKDPVCGIYMENSLLWIETFWALLMAGVRPLLMNLLLDKNSLKKAAAYAGCSYIICDASKQKDIAAAFEGFTVVTAESIDHEKELLRPSFDFNAARSAKRSFAEEIIFMTSGTTENVKLCCYTADRFAHQIAYSFEIIKKNRIVKRHYNGELKQLAFLPFYHIFGFVAVYLWFGFFSRTFVFLNDLSPETLTNTVRRRHVTHVFAVPLFWNKVYDGAMKKVSSMGPATVKKLEKGLKIAEAIYNIPLLGRPLGNAFSHAAFKQVRTKLFGESIAFMISGGGPLRRDVQRFFNLIGYRLVNGFGMTETSITSVELSNSVRQILKGSVGSPLDKVSYRTEEGELLIKGQVMAKRIIENGVEKELPEWFKTKDLAEKKGKAYFILGRADDLIIPESGENINPDMVEKYLYTEGVESLCAVKYGSGAAIVCEVTEDADEQKIREIRAAVSANAMNTTLRGNVTKIVITKQKLIPGGDFKISRKKLISKLESGMIKDVSESGETLKTASDAPENGLRDDETLAKIIDTIAAAKGIDPCEIKPDSDLFGEIGLTSLDFLEIISEAYQEYGVALPVSFEGQTVTPLKIRDAINDYLSGEGGAGA